MFGVMQNFPATPSALIRTLWDKRSLTWQLAKRDVVGRYRGSVFGLLWSFFNPLLMLAVYSFVFGYIFKARWGVGGEGRADFAITLFTGMVVFQIFAECVNKAPMLVIANPNFVKKVVFPLEMLPVVTCLSALFHAAVSLLVLVLAIWVVKGGVPWTGLYMPVLVLPYCLLLLGVSWILASLGVYIRDIGQSIGLVTMVFNFLSPVFYPASALPVQMQPILFLNPVTFICEQARLLLIAGHQLDWAGYAIYSVASLIVFSFGFFWFQRSRKGFADVL